MYDLSTQLRSALAPTEHLLWSGAPVTGIRFNLFDWFLIPFSIFWFGFAVVWETLAIMALVESIQDSFDPFVLLFPIFGIPFVFIGWHLLVGRFFADARARERTYYGITDRNIIIITGQEMTVHILPLASLPLLHLSERRDGTGTINLGVSLPEAEEGGDGKGRSKKPPSAMIELIPNARTVYELLEPVWKRTCAGDVATDRFLLGETGSDMMNNRGSENVLRQP